MLIGELSKRTGLSRDTIRFYEKESLVKPRKRARSPVWTNDYKDYPEEAVADLLFVQRTKVLGFTLSEIRNMLSVRGQGQPSKKWAAEAEEKLRDIDRKILELNEIRGLLSEAMARCSDGCFDSGCEVLDGAMAKKAGGVANSPHPQTGGCCAPK